MKAKSSDITSILKKPHAKLRVILLYGPDKGLVSFRAQQAAQAISPDTNNPFLVSKWSEDQLLKDPSKLVDDVNAISLIGGRRVICIQPVTDRFTSLLKPLLDSSTGKSLSDTLVVAQAAELPPRSSLRKLAETSTDAVAIPCYEDNTASRRSLIKHQCSQANLKIHPDALAYLIENLGSDHGVSRQELEKLILYMGPSQADTTTITLKDARAVIGDSAAWRIDDIADSMLLGNMERLERNFLSALQAGATAVHILNVASASVRRIHALASQIERGTNPASAIANQRPPVPFFRRDIVLDQLHYWQRKRLDRVLSILATAETACKSGLGVDISVSREAIWRIAAIKCQSSCIVAASA